MSRVDAISHSNPVAFYHQKIVFKSQTEGRKYLLASFCKYESVWNFLENQLVRIRQIRMESHQLAVVLWESNNNIHH